VRRDDPPRHIGPDLAARSPGASHRLPEPLRGPLRKVSQYSVCTGSLHGYQRLEGYGSSINPAIAGGGHDHRILPADLVDKRRHTKMIFDPAHDVEVG